MPSPLPKAYLASAIPRPHFGTPPSQLHFPFLNSVPQGDDATVTALWRGLIFFCCSTLSIPAQRACVITKKSGGEPWTEHRSGGHLRKLYQWSFCSGAVREWANPAGLPELGFTSAIGGRGLSESEA